jgi:uncharacterized protein YbjQ (UPF0145 family)
MLVVTTDTVPGHEIDAVCGEVFGLAVRVSIFGIPLSGGRGLGGGEAGLLHRSLSQGRDEAMAALINDATRRGANAVVAMRVAMSPCEGGQATQVCAYGTAVRVRPVDHVPA